MTDANCSSAALRTPLGMTRLLAAAGLLLLLAACGGSSGGDAPAAPPSPPPAGTALQGTAVKGPLTNATLQTLGIDYSQRGTFTQPLAIGNSDDRAAFRDLYIPDDVSLPLVLQVTAGPETVDLSTSNVAAPTLGQLRTLVTSENLALQQAVYPNPLTTMALELAFMLGDTGNTMFGGNGDNLDAEELSEAFKTASKLVISAFGMGLPATTDLATTPPLLTEQTNDLASQTLTTQLRTAIETIAALVHEVWQQLPANSGYQTDDVLIALAHDLADGTINGMLDGDALEPLAGIADLAGVLSVELATLNVPNTIYTLADIPQMLADEKDATGNPGVDSTDLENGMIEAGLAPINLAPDSDNDGTLDLEDPDSNDACVPGVFNANCNSDTDEDGASDFAETETADSDGDGTADYLESSIDDADSDGVNDQDDAANTDPCAPDPDAAACPHGLSQRPSNLECIAPELVFSGDTVYEAVRTLPNVSFSNPVKAVQAPGEPEYWYVVEQSGTIVRVQNDETTSSTEIYFQFDAGFLPGTETGLLGLAFDPEWPTTKEFYIAYAHHEGGVIQSRISRIVVLDDSSTPVTTEAEQVLLTLDQPKHNHNGGDIGFDTDGHLYSSLGDGGGPNDVFGNSQITSHLFSSIIRIDVQDVSHPDPGYLVPPGNPFSGNPKCNTGVGSLDCPEIFAWGFRNPWRFSIDPADNALWVADVGQEAREEIDIVTAGGNYGWGCKEGTVAGPKTGCVGTLLDPIHEYDHSNNDVSVTGGFVYRGSEIPQLQGQYIFGDYISGRIWSLAADGSGAYTSTELVDTSLFISSFAVDLAGEIYLTDYVGGGLYKLARSAAIDSSAIPDTLSQNACVQASDPANPVDGMIPYTPNAPFWSDGAVKSRWIGIPDSTAIDASAENNYVFPPGTVAMKNFVVEDKLVETRFFMRHPDGSWAGYTYEWDESETEATRVRDGKVRTLSHTAAPQDWIYPAEDQCLTCHTSAGGRLLGFNTAQLNGESFYPSTGKSDNQLETLNHIDYFQVDVPEPVASLPALPDPQDIAIAIESRAKAYLHTNCAGCHQPGGTAPTAMDLRYNTPLNAMNVCDITPQRTDLGIADAKLIAPGDTGKSIIYQRMNLRDGNAMPPIGSDLVDTEGLNLIAQWISQLSCSAP